MMSDIILITGLPGSGKTHLGQEISARDQIPFYDDASHLPDALPFILTHPAFCKDSALDTALAQIKDRWPDAKITLLSFENDPDKALKNAQTRANKKTDGYIAFLTKTYTPRGEILPIYAPD